MEKGVRWQKLEDTIHMYGEASMESKDNVSSRGV